MPNKQTVRLIRKEVLNNAIQFRSFYATTKVITHSRNRMVIRFVLNFSNHFEGSTLMRACITIILLSLFSLSAIRAEEKEAPAGAKSRKFQFTYTATLDTIPDGAKSVDLWIPIPQDNAHQTISNLTFKSDPAPDIGLEPELNNRIAHWKFDATQAKGKSVTMSFDCVRKEISAKDLDKARDL